ncbi:MAG: phenylacetate-CoA oxygenase subunit PaaC [Alphaproteobacteria bacterium]|nr:phenylacetate-CoA oxygenase subunit PaaC [Alphaproteobacteria bacterium]
MDDPIFTYALRIGDDALVLGQRVSEWCGTAPTLEVDLSLANVALDLIGQATLFLGLAGEIEGAGRDADRLAFFRDVDAFQNALMVEQPNGDFARTIARQFLFSTYQEGFYGALSHSAEPRLAAIAAKAVKEVRYHAALAGDWIVRLGDGTDESRQRMIEALDWHWRFVDELFAMDAGERALLEKSIAVDRAALRPAFDAAVGAILAAGDLPAPRYPQRPVMGGRRGHHSEHLGHLLATLQHIPRSYPDARW